MKLGWRRVLKLVLRSWAKAESTQAGRVEDNSIPSACCSLSTCATSRHYEHGSKAAGYGLVAATAVVGVVIAHSAIFLSLKQASASW